MKRRAFLATAGGGLVVTLAGGCRMLPVIPKRPAPDLEDAAGWIRHVDGRFVLVIPRVEMGQNVLTAMKRIACDELGADWDRVDALDAAGPWDIDLRVDVPPAAHASIEPRAAVAEWWPDGTLQAWVGHQDVFYVRDALAARLGLREANVHVHGQRVGGAFGGKTVVTVELEAAVLARATGGAVKVQWSRAQEFEQGFHRPASSHRIRARLEDGRVDAWWHAFASGHVLFTNAVLPPWLQRLTDFVGDDGVARGALPPHRTGATRVEFDLVRLPILSGPWRGLGAGPARPRSSRRPVRSRTRSSMRSAIVPSARRCARTTCSRTCGRPGAADADDGRFRERGDDEGARRGPAPTRPRAAAGGARWGPRTCG